MVQLSAHHRFSGLDVNSNPLAVNPYKELGSGARSSTIIADNCDLVGAGKISNRRGFDYFTQTNSLITAMFEYQANIVEHQNGNAQLWHGDNSSGTRTQYSGSYTAPSGYVMDAAISRGSLFFTTNNGPYKLDAIGHVPARAGLTKALDTRLTLSGTGGGFMSGFSKACYRITWTRLDANGQLVRSDVAARIIVTNANRVTISTATQAAGVATITTASAHGFTTSDSILISGVTPAQYNGSYTITVTGGTTFTYAVSGSPGAGTVFGTAEKTLNVSVAFTAPFEALATDSYEVWRSVTKDAGTPDPGDTCFLVATAVFGGSPGATVTYVDSTSDTILQTATPLYTNAGSDGPTTGNARPPVCVTTTNYKDYGIYGNTALDAQITINLLTVSGFTNGTSKITITPTTGSTRQYTANTAENIGTATFQNFGSGSPSANITNTMQSFCHVVNGDSSGLWYAEYLSFGNPNNNPGIVRIWARNPTSGSFTLTADSTTTGNQFNPVLPTAGTTVISSNDARPNRLFFSKFQQPDHVPLLNFIDVGKLSEPIQRVIASRDALYVIKTDGIWFLSGFTLPSTPNELDTTCYIIAPASARAVNNQIYMLANQGFVQVSTSGVTVISFDIEPLISPLLTFANIGSVSFGVGHESERKYICWVPSLSGDTYATQAFVFHTFLQSWVRWTKPANAGLALNSNYCLYLSSGVETALLKQRKSNDVTDFSDEALAITITAQTGITGQTLTVTYTNLNFPPTPGLTIHQGAVLSKVVSVTNVSGTSWTFQIDRAVVYSLAAATARLPIYAHIRCAPDVCGDSGIVKTFYNAVLSIQQNTVTQATVEIGTNEGAMLTPYPITRALSGGWGTNAWGDTGWGDASNPVSTIPFSVDVNVPDNSGEAITIGWLHNVSQEPFTLVQASIFYDANAEYEVVA